MSIYFNNTSEYVDDICRQIIPSANVFLKNSNKLMESRK